MNWIGKVTVGPRSGLAELAKRKEVKRTGIYLLVGPDPHSPIKDRVYVGEGDNVLTRLVKHEGDESKDFWTRTVVVTSEDENLTEDIPFNSPSAAAGVVFGGNQRGPTVWKTKQGGQTDREWHEA